MSTLKTGSKQTYSYSQLGKDWNHREIAKEQSGLPMNLVPSALLRDQEATKQSFLLIPSS